MGVYQSGQMGQTVNLLVIPSEVRILPPPLHLADPCEVFFSLANINDMTTVVWTGQVVRQGQDQYLGARLPPQLFPALFNCSRRMVGSSARMEWGWWAAI